MEIFASSMGTKRPSRYATPRAPKPASATPRRYQRGARRCYPVAADLAGRQVDVLELRVVLERVGAELATHARLLEAAERCVHSDRGVRVDGDRSRLDRPSHTKCAGAVPSPDRP